MSRVVLVKLSGALRPWVTAKRCDIVIKKVNGKGGVGKIFEYGGEGVKTLTVTERATITNMGRTWGAYLDLPQ